MTSVLLLALTMTPGQHQRPNYYPPGYQPQQHYYPAQKVIAQEVNLPPLIVTVPVDSKAVPVQAYGSPHYYSSSDAYREKARVREIREIVREELRSILSGNAAGGTTGTSMLPQRPGGPAIQPQTPPQQPQQPQTPPQQPQASAPDDVTPAELQKAVIAAYNGKAGCLTCHGATGTASGPKVNGKTREFRLVVESPNGLVLTKYPSDKRWKIYAMASVGAMPPKAAEDASKAMETKYLQTMLQYASVKDPE